MVLLGEQSLEMIHAWVHAEGGNSRRDPGLISIARHIQKAEVVPISHAQ